MQTPVEITFRHCEATEEMRAEIAAQVRRLEEFSPNLISCRVVVTGPQTRHHSGSPFQVELIITMPERKEIVVDKGHGDAPEREHPLVAIREAFHSAARQIQDAAHEMRGEVKEHVAESQGRVARFLAGEDCGFIEAADGREIYFHRNAVLDGAFDRLILGSEVRFVEEEGEKGAQASTVRPIGKHHIE